jgi:hypothetical protein
MPSETNGRNRKEPKPDTRQTPRMPSVDVLFMRLRRDFLPINEAADAMGLQPITLRKYCQDNIFSNAQQFGREWVIAQDDIDWWNANRRGKVGRPKMEL